jgi:hypothetical protein
LLVPFLPSCFQRLAIVEGPSVVRLRTFANAMLLLLGAGPAAAQVIARPMVVFHGNVLFDELVYRSVLQLPESAGATADGASAASEKLLSFLRRAGYDLATVRAAVVDEQIAVEIDEGRLDKIIVLGEGLVATFRFRMDLSVPSGVFNRPALERQLRVLGERYRLNHYRYDLVPAEVQENRGLQLEELEPLLGTAGVRPGLRYQLHIHLVSSPWSRGFAPEVSIGSPEGLGGGGHFRERDFFVADDRWEVTGRLAGGMRQHLDSPGSRPVFTRTVVEGRWFSPPVFTESLRPALTVRGDLLSLQRGDLRLESFSQATFASSIDAGVFKPNWTFALGVGIERRFIFAIVKVAGANPLLDETPRAQTRPYGEAIADVVFNGDELRTDRKHRLNFEARFYTGSPSSQGAIWLHAGWQRRFPMGWHELLWEARGTMLEGQVLFPDEESLGNHLHGAFGGSTFVRKAAGTGIEFRYSLLRDVVKLGLFYDQVVFGALDRTAVSWSTRSAGAGGPAFHLLLADEFQVDVYFAIGWKTDGSTDFAPALVLRQVF